MQIAKPQTDPPNVTKYKKIGIPLLKTFLEPKGL